jgi:very-short-patch-repair endonuclease
MTRRARRLRQNMTDAERSLWNALRRRQIGNIQFRRQHAIGNYVLDFYSPSIQLAIEIDGGQHNTEPGRVADSQRTRRLNERGIVVLRYWNNDVMTNLGGVLEDIARSIEEKRSFSPPPEGGRSAAEGRREAVGNRPGGPTPPRRATRADPPLSGEGEEGSAS